VLDYGKYNGIIAVTKANKERRKAMTTKHTDGPDGLGALVETIKEEEVNFGTSAPSGIFTSVEEEKQDEYVPYTFEDDLAGMVVSFGNNAKYVIVGQGKTRVALSQRDNASYNELLEGFTHLDGTPFGKKMGNLGKFCFILNLNAGVLCFAHAAVVINTLPVIAVINLILGIINLSFFAIEALKNDN
jgi:hypothetical protein